MENLSANSPPCLGIFYANAPNNSRKIFFLDIRSRNLLSRPLPYPIPAAPHSRVSLPFFTVTKVSSSLIPFSPRGWSSPVTWHESWLDSGLCGRMHAHTCTYLTGCNGEQGPLIRVWQWSFQRGNDVNTFFSGGLMTAFSHVETMTRTLKCLYAVYCCHCWMGHAWTTRPRLYTWSKTTIYSLNKHHCVLRRIFWMSLSGHQSSSNKRPVARDTRSLCYCYYYPSLASEISFAFRAREFLSFVLRCFYTRMIKRY